MTDPNIIKMERDGYIGKPPKEPIDRCACCGSYIYEDNKDAVEDMDNAFCDMRCLIRYNKIKHIVDKKEVVV